jgi:tetratricopeptide (TPR) repeat protein
MPESPRDAPTPLSWRKKLLFALFTTAAFFLLLEVGLALLGVDRVTDSRDPFIGFSRRIPLMELDADADDGPTIHTASGKLPWFNPQSFPAKKPAGTRRLFCVGGSTTFGRPFADLTSYCGHLRELLPVVDPAFRWEVINAGGVSYASYRVAAVMEELARYEPDLFIVYSAHNEFLERRTYAGMFAQSRWSREAKAGLQKSRVWSLVQGTVTGLRGTLSPPSEQLPGEVDEMLNHSIGPQDYHRDDRWRDNVLRHYEFNLDRMVDIARRWGAGIVFITPSANLRDCRPFKSEISADLSDDGVAEVGLQLELAVTYLDSGRYEPALEICDGVIAADGRNAEAHYLRGQGLHGLARDEEAKLAFERAIDEDVCPLRATTGMVDIIRRVALRSNVPLVDFRDRLEQKCRQELGHACLGDEYFLDHVHPTIDVHRDLALWIIDELQDQSLLGGQPPTADQVTAVRERIDQQIDTRAQGVAFRNLAKVMHWAGRFREAARRALDALRLIPGDLESQFVLAECLHQLGRDDEAIETYQQLFSVGDFPRAHLPFGLLLAEHGEDDAAQLYLLQALVTAREEHRPLAHYTLGRVYLRMADYEPAVEMLREADRLYPDDPVTLLSLADAYLGIQDQEMAIESLRRVIALDGDNFQAHYRLGMVLLDRDELDAARKQIERAGEIDPTDPLAIKALESIDAARSDASE